MNVILIGGGIGGLCLAQGLRKAGVSVTVFEKGPKRADPHWLEGYQIHINPSGANALQECLPLALWKKLLDNSCVPSAGLQILTEQLKTIGFVEAELMNGSSHVPIVRATLREVLLDGLDDVVQFGKEFMRYESRDSKITAFFRDGTTATGDILVGADGTGSTVRGQYLPYARVVETGIVGAACRLPVDAVTRSRVAEHLLTRLTSILPPKSGYMIVTQSIFKPTASEGAHDIRDHLIWVFISSRAAYGSANPKTMEGGAIQALVLHMTGTWHPVLRQLVDESDARQIAAVPLLTSRPIKPWQSTNVTLLGDAIHTMTPLQGLGGSTALRDAGTLCRKLVQAHDGHSTLVDAIRDYEAAMLEYGFSAVRRSELFGKLVASQSRVLRAGFKTALRVVTRVPALKRRVFRASSWS